MNPYILDKTLFYYFFSAIPQILAGVIALVGVFYIFAYQEIRERMKSIPRLIRDYFKEHIKRQQLGSIDAEKYESILLDFESVMQFPTGEKIVIIIKSINDFFKVQISKNPPNVNISRDRWETMVISYHQAYDKLNSEISKLSRLTKTTIVYNSVIIAISIIILTLSNSLPDEYLKILMDIILVFSIIGIFLAAVTVYLNIRPRKLDKIGSYSSERTFIERINCYLTLFLERFHLLRKSHNPEN